MKSFPWLGSWLWKSSRTSDRIRSGALQGWSWDIPSPIKKNPAKMGTMINCKLFCLTEILFWKVIFVNFTYLRTRKTLSLHQFSIQPLGKFYIFCLSDIGQDYFLGIKFFHFKELHYEVSHSKINLVFKQ